MGVKVYQKSVLVKKVKVTKMQVVVKIKLSVFQVTSQSTLIFIRYGNLIIKVNTPKKILIMIIHKKNLIVESKNDCNEE